MSIRAETTWRTMHCHAVFTQCFTISALVVYTDVTSMQQNVYTWAMRVHVQVIYTCPCWHLRLMASVQWLPRRRHLLMASCIASQLNQGCRISSTPQHQRLPCCQSLPHTPQVRCRLGCHIWRTQTVCQQQSAPTSSILLGASAAHFWIQCTPAVARPACWFCRWRASSD